MRVYMNVVGIVVVLSSGTKNRENSSRESLLNDQFSPAGSYVHSNIYSLYYLATLFRLL